MFEKRHSAKWPGHDSAAAFFSEICIVAFVFKFGNSILQCNELNRGHPTFFYQSQDEFRTKESEFVHFGPIANEGLAVKNSFPSGKSQLNIYWKAPRKTLGGPGWVRYTVNITDIKYHLTLQRETLNTTPWDRSKSIILRNNYMYITKYGGLSWLCVGGSDETSRPLCH